MRSKVKDSDRKDKIILNNEYRVLINEIDQTHVGCSVKAINFKDA